jgi:hypothetical protein
MRLIINNYDRKKYLQPLTYAFFDKLHPLFISAGAHFRHFCKESFQNAAARIASGGAKMLF